MTSEDVWQELLEAIDVASNDGPSACASFAAGGTAPLTLPLLRVANAASEKADGILISLPVTSEQAQALAEAGEQAPHGRGEATVVDKNVRDTRRFGKQRLQFENPAWSRMVDQLVASVKTGLGVLQGVKAELYNLLVYSEGGHFARHRDSEKCPGMFGTLVVSLPCQHRGGALVVRHNGHEQRFETATDVPSEIQWFAFYADAEHELLPVESGHRVVLIYNLVRTGVGELPRAPPEMSAGALALRQVVSRWDERCGLKVSHILEHQYSQEGLNWDALKGNDIAVVAALRQSRCFDMELVTIKFTEYGDDDCGRYGPYGYGEPEIHDSKLDVDLWLPDPENVDLPDAIVRLYDRDLGKDDFLQGEDYFADLDPDGEEHEGPTGNEGAPMSRWYTAAAIVLRPKKLRFAAAGPETCAQLLDAALDGDVDSLCGFATVQELCDASFKVLLSHPTDIARKVRCTPAIASRFLLAHGSCKPGQLSQDSAMRLLRALAAGSICAPMLAITLSAGLRSVLDRLGLEDEEVRAAVLHLLSRGALKSESQAKAAFELLPHILGPPDGQAASPAQQSLHAEVAHALVKTLGGQVEHRQGAPRDELTKRGICEPPLYASNREQKMQEYQRQKTAVSVTYENAAAKRTLCAVVNALHADGDGGSVPEAVLALGAEAADVICGNDSRFSATQTIAPALELLCFTRRKAAPGTDSPSLPPSVPPAGPLCSKLLQCTVARVAALETALDEAVCGAKMVKCALVCAIEAKAVESWAPLSRRFAAKPLAAALATLAASHRRASLTGTVWTQALSDLTAPLLAPHTPPAASASHWQQPREQHRAQHLTAPVCDAFVLAAALDAAVGGQEASTTLADQVIARWPVKPAVVELAKALGTALRGREHESAGFAMVVRRCIEAIRPLTLPVPPLAAQHTATLSKVLVETSNGGGSATYGGRYIGSGMSVAGFFRSRTASFDFRGREFTWYGSETERLGRLAASTGLFSIERISSKAAKVNGVLRVTKGQAWQAADKAKAHRDAKVAQGEADTKLLEELTALMPTAAMTQPEAKRPKSISNAGSVAKAPLCEIEGNRLKIASGGRAGT